MIGKYEIYFPCDGETVDVYPNDKDLGLTLLQYRHLSSHYMNDSVFASTPPDSCPLVHIECVRKHYTIYQY